MNFVSLEFIIFAAFTITIYFLTAPARRWIIVLLSSYFFYAYSHLPYIPILLASTIVDFYAGKRIYQSPNKKSAGRWLMLSLTVNFGMLFFFKYYAFFCDQIELLFHLDQINYSFPRYGYLLPIGISFYTFQSVSYSVDIYRGYIKPEKHFGRFAIYVCFFPQLLAGPIERASKLLPQFHFNYKFDHTRTVQGLRLILWGFFKKLVIANQIGIYVDHVFNLEVYHHGATILAAALLFWLQLFYDFSSYTDIAIGLALIMGIKLTRNFYNHIYVPSFTQFWKEWHITLTNWFRNYVFFTLVSHTKWKYYWYFSLFVTFTLVGLWHGASWTFILWGAFNGLVLIYERVTLKKRKAFVEKLGHGGIKKMIRVMSIVIVLMIGMLPGLLFRSGSMEVFSAQLSRLIDWSPNLFLTELDHSFQICLFSLLILFEAFNIRLGKERFDHFLDKKTRPYRWIVYVVLCMSLLFMGENENYIYFQF